MTLTDDNFRPEHEREYRAFLMWKVLPSFLFKTPEGRLELLDFDDDILELLKYKSQKELADHLGISEQTISDWNNRPIAKGYEDFDWKIWAKKLTKNIIGALYRQALIDADAPRIKLWLQLIEDWSEKSTIDLNSESLDRIEEHMRAIVKRGQDEATDAENAGGIQEDSPPAV